MKIIGKTDHGYIAEISNGEASHLFYTPDLPIGREIDLVKSIRSLDTLRTLDTTNIKLAKEQTKKVLDKLEELSNTISALTIFDTLSTTQEN